MHDWRIEGTEAKRIIFIRLARPLSEAFSLIIVSEQVQEASGEVYAVRPFVVAGAARQTGRFAVRELPARCIAEAGLVGLHRATCAEAGAENSSSAGLALAYDYFKLPAELKLKLVPVLPRISASVGSLVKLHSCAVDMLSRIEYQIADAPVERLRLGLNEGLLVLGITGEAVETWEASGAEVEVRLKRPVMGALSLDVRCLENLRKVNGVLIPRLRCLDAERESGAIGLSAGEDVALQHFKGEKIVQAGTELLPSWLRAFKPKLAYLYDQPEWSLMVIGGLNECHPARFERRNTGHGSRRRPCRARGVRFRLSDRAAAVVRPHSGSPRWTGTGQPGREARGRLGVLPRAACHFRHAKTRRRGPYAVATVLRAQARRCG